MPSSMDVNIELIIPPKHQPRHETGDVSDIAEAIVSVQQFFSVLPVERRADGKFMLIAGNRRYWAMKQVLKEMPDFPAAIPVIVYEPDEVDAAVKWAIAQQENRVRRALTPVDEACAIKELRLRLDCRDRREHLEGTHG